MYGVKLSLISGQFFHPGEGIKNGYDNNNRVIMKERMPKIYISIYSTLLIKHLWQQATNVCVNSFWDEISIQCTYKFVYNLEPAENTYLVHIIKWIFKCGDWICLFPNEKRQNLIIFLYNNGDSFCCNYILIK